MDYKKFEVDFFSKNYETGEHLGSGGYGTTFVCVNNLDKKRYVVKLIPCTDENTEKMLRECEVMAKFKHENVVQYYCAWLEAGTPECAREFAAGLMDSQDIKEDDFASEEEEEVNFGGGADNSEEKEEDISAGFDDDCEEKEEEDFSGADDDLEEKEEEIFAGVGDDFEENVSGGLADSEQKEEKEKVKHPRTLCIAMEYYPRVLKDELEAGKNYTEEELADILRGLAKALYYLHGEGWLHCDLHPGNIFFGDNGNPILADFGLSRKKGEEVIVSRGRKEYLPDEVVKGQYYTTGADVFSLAMVMMEMVCSFETFQEKALAFNDARRGVFSEKLAGNVVGDIVRAVLQAPHPAARLTPRNILDMLG